MKTTIHSWGRRGVFEFSEGLNASRAPEISIEPWGASFYLLQGFGIPLIYLRELDRYRDYTVRSFAWSRLQAEASWLAMKDAWLPLLDYVIENDFHRHISFKLNARGMDRAGRWSQATME